MNNQTTNINKDEFINVNKEFFDTIFKEVLENKLGRIEIRTFKPRAQQYFFNSEMDAAEKAYALLQNNYDVYFGVNPRDGKGGKKENVEYLVTFHAEIDYGKIGHKKDSQYNTYEETLNVIQNFQYEPTIIIHSGGGFHCYWVLDKPVRVKDVGILILENINIALCALLNGDSGTQDISRVLRVPGTLNLKDPDNPRPVTLISNTGKKYTYDELIKFLPPKKKESQSSSESIPGIPPSEVGGSYLNGTVSVSSYPLPDKIKTLIKNGNDGSYKSRSEADMAVIIALLRNGRNYDEIKHIFINYPIGEKYRTHNDPEKYLRFSVEKAKKMTNLSEEELQNPLFISGSLFKDNKGIHLSIVRLQEYIVRKYKLKVLDKERAIFKYNGKCYEYYTDELLNRLCQQELGEYRELFIKSTLDQFIHFAIGDVLIRGDKSQSDQINYLTLQNGLYELETGQLIEHSPDIFTTNLLPYNYDPSAQCPRYLQFLDEIFINDKDKISFIQEAVGYAFHKSLPTAAIFFLVGDGNNGKSVFINTISNLVGKENTSNVSFNALSDQIFILELFQKMINISGETPHAKQINTDLIKAVASGDWVTGRELYKQPMKFRPYAKHYLAMNKLPIINDASYGMWRRIRIIEFPRKFEEHEMDRELESKLVKELSGIFNWAIEGYRRLKSNKFELKDSQKMTDAKQEYQNELDSVRAYVNENLVKSSNDNDRLKFSDLYIDYQAYCQNQGKDIQTKSFFKDSLRNMKYKVEYSTKDSNQLYVFNVKKCM